MGFLDSLDGSAERALRAGWDSHDSSTGLKAEQKNEKQVKATAWLEKIKEIREDLDLDETSKIKKLGEMINWEQYKWLRVKIGSSMDADPIFAGVAKLNFPKKAEAIKQEIENAAVEPTSLWGRWKKVLKILNENTKKEKKMENQK